jgi:hypothetical protein
MAQTIVTLCDECLAGGSEVPGRPHGVTLEVPGSRPAPYVVDACDMHAEPIRALLKALGEYGRRTDRKAPLPRASTGAVLAPDAATDAVDLACPVDGCAFVSTTPGGVDSHVKSAHGISLAEAKGVADIACPEPGCTRKLARFQGLSAHLRTGHGYPTAKARQAVEAAGGGGRG